MNLLNPFMPLISSKPFEHIRKLLFFIFSGGRKRVKWHEKG